MLHGRRTVGAGSHISMFGTPRTSREAARIGDFFGAEAVLSVGAPPEP